MANLGVPYPYLWFDSRPENQIPIDSKQTPALWNATCQCRGSSPSRSIRGKRAQRRAFESWAGLGIMTSTEKIAELQQLEARVAALQAELAADSSPRHDWPPSGYYFTYHILAGMVLGLIGASASLIFNIIGALMFGMHPLEIIRVYLTFPLGEKALATDAGFTLAAGCCLYLGTGMLGGIPFHLILDRFYARAGMGKRFVVASVLALGVWVINYYGFLSWAQPLMTGGRWILDEIPIFVAISTHLVFGWTLLLVDQWGQFVPYSGRPKT